MKNKNIILGIDGIPYELMDNLSNQGYMPNFQELKKDYYFKEMKSSIPHISSVSWSSIITGENPGEHGIFGFTEIIPNTYTISFPNFNALKKKPFWQFDEEKKNFILNVPSTYPAKKLNGVQIAGFVALDLEKAVYPREIISTLKNINYEIDIDSSIAQKQSKDALFNELSKVLKIREKTCEFFWNKEKWDNFMVVITSSDRFGHFLWNTYTNHKDSHHYRCLEFFTQIDSFIGNLKNKLKEDDRFIILSDHGMESVFKNVNINVLLEQEGFLNLSKTNKKYNRIEKGSKAFALDPGRIYLNLKNKYPNGTLLKKERKEVLEELKTSFYELKYKKKPVIKSVFEKEEIYHGTFIDHAPDLVIVENRGFQPRSGIGKLEVFENDKFQGMHNSSAFLFLNKNIKLENPTVEDVVNLIN